MSFWERMEEVVNQGLESSRDILSKAREKARDLGEKGLLHYEIMQLERQAEKKFSQLGVRVYEALVLKSRATVGKANVEDLLKDILELKERIEEKEQALKELGKQV